jgi:hypothetical protein
MASVKLSDVITSQNEALLDLLLCRQQPKIAAQVRAGARSRPSTEHQAGTFLL